MSDMNWYGSFAFADTASRDRGKAMLEDWRDATQGTEDYENSDGINGIHAYNNLDVGAGPGPALRFSFRCYEAAYLTTGTIADRVDAISLGGSGSGAPIT